MADYDVKVLEISKGGNTYTYDAGGMHYAVCDTAAGTQTKAVTISEIASLTTGLSVRIKFSNAQTYNGQPKLQINSLTATNIVRMGTTAAAQYEWNAGEVLDFVYDGTNFIIQEGAVPTTTYYGSRIKLSSATNSTSEALAATPKAVKAAYDLANGKASTSVASQSANGLMSSTDKTKLDGIATGATANVGTITGITMNGASKGTSGVVNLGTVLTSHQDISGKSNRDEIGIVITGNTASQNVTSGQYVIVRNSTISGISDGLYTASANISAGTAFTSANLTAVSNGGLNSLNEQITNHSDLPYVQDANDAPYGWSRADGGYGTNLPLQNSRFSILTSDAGTQYYKPQIAISDNGNGIFYRNYDTGLSAWTAWQELATSEQIGTLSNNTGKVTLSSEVYYQKRGNVCTVWCNNRSFSSTTSFGTLPVGCRPANTIRQPNYDSTCYLQVNNDGTVAGYLAPNQSGTKYLVTCCVSFVVA